MSQIARTPKQIGDAIRRQRRIRHISQSNLGELTQLRQATISAVEHGEPGTQLQTICNVMAALGLEFVVRARTTVTADEIEAIF